MLSYVGVATLAGLVGVVEILSRYRDVPFIVLREWPAWMYIGTNALAGITALLVIDVFDWTIAEGAEANVQRGLQIAVAAFGALAIMRTAVIQMRINDRDLNVGPSLLLNVLLDFTASSMSRKRAGHLDKIVKKIMSEVDFDKAKEPLPSYCFSLMRTSDDVQKDVSREITSLDIPTLGNNTKSLQLGLVLLNLVGADVLSQAVETLKDEICLGSQRELS